MKILFCMRGTIYVRNFESTLRMLAERGHEVLVVADRRYADSDDLIRRLCAAYPGIHHAESPIVPFNKWSFCGTELRAAIDYLRYLNLEYENARKLRMRAEQKAPPFVLCALKRRVMNTRAGRRLLARTLEVLDRAVPHHPEIERFVRAINPDVLLVTPLVEPGSPQSEYVRAARSLGVPVALCVYSWDNLTNKGLIHDRLDLVTVWNDAMKDEAIRLHHVPSKRVEVTGAVAYDHWFDWRPRASRREFCARVGLRADRPYILYLCSSRFIAPNETDFIRRWITELRASSAALRDVDVLVRPHPQNLKQWSTPQLTDLGGVVVWPREGANPVDEISRADYYDSICHSAAVVGVNTSALIESAVIGRSIYTVLLPEFHDTQEGTLHFHHLLNVNGGVLNVAHTMQEHAAQLEAALRGSDDKERCHRFVEAFVRPRGMHVPATPRLVEAIERTAAFGKRRRDHGPWYRRLLRPPLARVATRLARTDRAQEEKLARGKAIKHRREAIRASEREHAIAAKREVRVQRTAEDAALTNAYAHYLKVRDWLRPFSGSHSGLTAVEQEMAARLGHLWDATPDMITALRQSCEPITGVGPADYAESSSELFIRLKNDISFLRRQGGDDLFVQESPLLGGFGFRRQHGLYNMDTIRCFKALMALNDAAILDEFRGHTQRRLAWEIGGGWGGFAYQFKTTCPNVTYLITGLPETLLVAAVYLMTAFPEAQFRLHGVTREDVWLNWEQVDFILAPETALPDLKPPRVDLVIDLMTLRNMSDRRVACHVQRAFDIGARYFYSVEPGSIFPAESPRVWQAIERLYWPHPVPPRLDASLLVDPGSVPQLDDYAHLVGWRRIRPATVTSPSSLAAVG